MHCDLSYCFNFILAAGYTDIWPELQDGLLSTIADLAGFIQEFITASSGYDSYPGK